MTGRRPKSCPNSDNGLARYSRRAQDVVGGRKSPHSSVGKRQAPPWTLLHSYSLRAPPRAAMARALWGELTRRRSPITDDNPAHGSSK